MSNTSKNTQKLVLAAIFLALGLIMPFFTMQIPQIGSMLLPMHLPVLVCGFVCGWQYGLAVGFIVPLLRSVTFGMPPLFPTATAMAFELAVYGAVTGLMYAKFPKTNKMVYVDLIIAMIAGRIVWGAVSMICYSVAGKGFTWQMFVAGGFVNAIPGIILQIIVVPILVIALKSAKVISYERASEF